MCLSETLSAYSPYFLRAVYFIVVLTPIALGCHLRSDTRSLCCLRVRGGLRNQLHRSRH